MTQVWLGGVNSESRMISRITTHDVGTPPDPPVGVAGIFTIADLLFFVYVPLAWGTDRPAQELVISGGLGSVLRPIWPPRTEAMVWPQDRVLGLDLFEAMWGQGGAIVPGITAPDESQPIAGK